MLKLTGLNYILHRNFNPTSHVRKGVLEDVLCGIGFPQNYLHVASRNVLVTLAFELHLCHCTLLPVVLFQSGLIAQLALSAALEVSDENTKRARHDSIWGIRCNIRNSRSRGHQANVCVRLVTPGAVIVSAVTDISFAELTSQLYGSATASRKQQDKCDTSQC